MTDQEYSKLWDKLDTIENKTDKIYQGFYGISDTDDKGLLGKFNDMCNELNKLKRNFYILVAFMVGSGILGVGIWQALA